MTYEPVEEFTPKILENIKNNEIKEIKISFDFNSDLPELPLCVKIINFGNISLFDKEIIKLVEGKEGYLNNLCTSLYNKKFINLPEKLTHLYFPSNSRFNQPIDNLPSELIFLSFLVFLV